MKSFKVMLKPNNKQTTFLKQSAGTARWAYNWTLQQQEENYKNGGKFIPDGELRKRLTQLKQNNEDYKWLYKYSNNITKQAIKDACNAYKKFFKKICDKPKFKSRRKSKPSFYNDIFKIRFETKHVYLEKVGKIKLFEKDRIPTDVKYYNPRITFDGIHWFISVSIEEDNKSEELNDISLGIDVGIKDLAICSDGNTYKNINKTKKIKKLKKRLERLQRKVSKKYEKNKQGNKYIKTKNILKLEKTIRKTWININNIRTDYIHKTTTEIVRTKPSQIVMETLNIKGMMKNKHLSKSIQEQNLYEFKTFIKTKSESIGIKFIEVDKWFPSSKTCSCCNNIKKSLSLSDRIYICDSCGLEIDRDLNASINLSRYKVL